MKLIDWLKERELNARRIASGKSGADRAGWLEDANYFKAAVDALAAPAPQPAWADQADWPEDLPSFVERRAYQRGVADARRVDRAIRSVAEPGSAERSRDWLVESRGFRQQDDWILSPGASLMSDDSHEIIHVDTLRGLVEAAVPKVPSAVSAQHSIDPDGDVSRSGFRELDGRSPVRNMSSWQIWREAVRWATTQSPAPSTGAGLPEPTPLKLYAANMRDTHAAGTFEHDEAVAALEMAESHTGVVALLKEIVFEGLQHDGRLIPSEALRSKLVSAKQIIDAVPNLRSPSVLPRKPLSDADIEKLREKTFSTGNPYCPVDAKSMRKAVRAAEAAHGIKDPE